MSFWGARQAISLWIFLLVLESMCLSSSSKIRLGSKNAQSSCSSSLCRCRTEDGNKKIKMFCSLTTASVPEFTRLNIIYKKVSLERCGLKSLASDAFINVETRQLHISSNILSNDGIAKEAFRGLEDTLRSLWLSENSLTRVPSESLSRLHKLETLDLYRNGITELHENSFINNTNLKWLYLNYNKIEFIHHLAFAGLAKLEQLRLSLNEIRVLHTDVLLPLRSLQSIDLSFNYISNITSKMFKGSKKLRFVQLQSNRLTVLREKDFVGLRRLKYMWIDGNHLYSVEPGTFRPLRKLSLLSIDLASMSDIDAGLFADLNNLKTLMLDEIKHKSLPSHFFSSNPKIESISLTDYEKIFTGFHVDMFLEGYNFTQLDIAIEPIHECHCDVDWIKELTQKNSWVRGTCLNKHSLYCGQKRDYIKTKKKNGKNKKRRRERKHRRKPSRIRFVV